MAKIQPGDPVDIFTVSRMEAKVGDIKSSMLNTTEFNDENLGTWMLMNGQSCAGTEYEAITGNTAVPDMLTDGEFLRQAKSGRALGTKEGDAIRNITGTATGNYITSNPNSYSGALKNTIQQTSNRYGYTGGPYWGGRIDFDASLSVPTANENRPKNIACNFYIKVGY